MAKINNYALSGLKVNDKLLASDGDTGVTKNVSSEDVADLNGGATIYRAFLTQTGTNAPVAVVVGPNTIGDIVWTRSNTGVYVGTLANAFQGYVALISKASGSIISLAYSNTSGAINLSSLYNGVATDNTLSNHYIEIRVYNV